MQFTLWKQMYHSIFNPVIPWTENIKKEEKLLNVYVFISATVSCAKVKPAVTLKNAPR